MKLSKDQIENFTKSFYFDTSSINWLTAKLTLGDCAATRKHLESKNRIWIISPLNLDEIFCTKDPERRDELIRKAGQFLPSPGIIFDTPTRILFGRILDYTSSKYGPYEESVRKVWFDVVREDKAVQMDFDEFKRRRDTLNFFYQVTKYILNNPDWRSEGYKGGNILVKATLESLKYPRPSQIIIDSGRQLQFDIRMVLIYATFCFGVESDMTFIDEFWRTRDTSAPYNGAEVANRFYNICHEYEKELFTSHELDLMVDYVLFEEENRKRGLNRGTIRDSFHLVYSYFCAWFITDDQGILNFAQSHKWLKERVYSVRQDFKYVDSGTPLG